MAPSPRVRILLVEDEEPVRLVATRVLEGAGHTVYAAASPTLALEWCRDPAFAFDLLLSDVVMPGLDGPSLVERVRQQRTQFEVLFMSGYTGSSLVHHRLLQSSAALLQKPFTPRQLLSRIDEVLARRQARGSQTA